MIGWSLLTGVASYLLVGYAITAHPDALAFISSEYQMWATVVLVALVVLAALHLMRALPVAPMPGRTRTVFALAAYGSCLSLFLLSTTLMRMNVPVSNEGSNSGYVGRYLPASRLGSTGLGCTAARLATLGRSACRE